MTSAARSPWLSLQSTLAGGASVRQWGSRSLWLACRAQAAAVAPERVDAVDQTRPAAALPRLGQPGPGRVRTGRAGCAVTAVEVARLRLRVAGRRRTPPARRPRLARAGGPRARHRGQRACSLIDLGAMQPLCLHAPGAVLTAEGVDCLFRETARARRVSESLPALRRVVMAEATRRRGSPISLDLFATADNTLVPRFFAHHPEPLTEGGIPGPTGLGPVSLQLRAHAPRVCRRFSALRYLAGVSGEGALGRHAWGLHRSVHAI